MTAAIPPACCAGADHGKPHDQLDRICRADRGDFAFAGADAFVIRVGPDVLRNRLFPDADTDANADVVRQSVTDTVTFGQPFTDAEPHANPNCNGVANTDPNAYPDHHRRG